jgi:hypothetical protein
LSQSASVIVSSERLGIDARVAAEDVGSAVGFLHFGGGVAKGGQVGYIGEQRERVAAVLLNGLCNLRGGFGVDVQYGDLRAALGELLRHCATDAFRRARNHRHTPRKVGHRTPSTGNCT